MIPGVRGALLSQDALERVVPLELRGLLGEIGRDAARREMRTWHHPLRQVVGPASSCRTILDRIATPLLSQLGYHVLPEQAIGGRPDTTARAVLYANGCPAASLIVTGWNQDPTAEWRDAVRYGIAHGLRWCFCLTGPSLRIVDSARTYARQFVEFDLELALDDERTFAVFWGLLRAVAMAPSKASRTPVLDQAVRLSEEHRASVRSSLQLGVNEALGHLVSAFDSAAMGRNKPLTRSEDDPRVFNEALIVIYRILFLLFAEARGLVPQWHPVFRDGYTIEALRRPVEELPRPIGLWDTIQSIARLAHRGCHVDTLRVVPFNGRLFSPSESPLADTLTLDDGAVRQALLALTTTSSPSGRERIAYGDLGVEQLGGVYERVLDL